MKFRRFVEYHDIFGFELKRDEVEKNDDLDTKPIQQVDLETIIELLLKKTINNQYPYSKFHHEIIWGEGEGAIKIEFDPGYTAYIKKLIYDKTGQPVWLTIKMLQVNRRGFRGHEDKIAQTLFQYAQWAAQRGTEQANNSFNKLLRLANKIYQKVKQYAKPIFYPEGLKQIGQNTFAMCFAVKAHGVEAPSQRRVEQNQTIIHYDQERGIIHIFNQNIESPTGKRHSWKIMEKDLDVYFTPSQDEDEIAEVVAIHYKYY